MVDINERVNLVIDSLDGIAELGESEIFAIKSAVATLYDVVPTDLNLIFKSSDKIISTCGDLAWTIATLKKSRIKLNFEYKKLKDPVYTSLTRKGRPTMASIESEMRVLKPEISDYESKLETIDNVVEYLTYLYKCLESKQWNIKDRVSLSKI